MLISESYRQQELAFYCLCKKKKKGLETSVSSQSFNAN